jgi:hypothetical protein
MRSKILVAIITVAVMGVSTAAMAKGGGGGGGKGGSGGHVGHAGHAPFHARFDRQFLRNQFLLGGWGWGWGWPYNEGGYSNTDVVVYPQAIPQMATGSIAATPCHWNAETFTVPSSGGGNRPIQIVTCQ